METLIQIILITLFILINLMAGISIFAWISTGVHDAPYLFMIIGAIIVDYQVIKSII